MGPKAISKLLEWLQARDSKVQEWFCQIAGKQSLVPVRYTPASVRYLRAYQGFSALGLAAKPALPDLARLFQEPDFAAQAASVLGLLGPEAVPVLRAGLSNQHEQIRSAAARTLGKMGQMP